MTSIAQVLSPMTILLYFSIYMLFVDGVAFALDLYLLVHGLVVLLQATEVALIGQPRGVLKAHLITAQHLCFVHLVQSRNALVTEIVVRRRILHFFVEAELAESVVIIVRLELLELLFPFESEGEAFIEVLIEWNASVATVL